MAATILDVEPTRAIRQAEGGAAKTMINQFCASKSLISLARPRGIEPLFSP